MIIGLNGAPRCGKDTVANFLESQGFHHLKFARAVKEEAHKIYNIRDSSGNVAPHDFYENVKDTKFLKVNEAIISPRDLYIGIGEGYKKYYGEDYWCKKITFDSNTNYVISDVGFEYEAQHIRDCGGIIVGISREGTSFANDSRGNVSCDYLINNNGTIQDLHFNIVKTLNL